VPTQKEKMARNLRKDTETWMAGQDVDRAADYAARGRKYRALPAEQLTEQWTAAFRRMADTPADYNCRGIVNDLTSEFHLCSPEPPYDRAKDEMNRYCAFSVETIEAMKRDDPEKFNQINKDILRDIDAALERIKKSN
jgi:hypothetical protein